jgi:hypothetical protein
LVARSSAVAPRLVRRARPARYADGLLDAARDARARRARALGRLSRNGARSAPFRGNRLAARVAEKAAIADEPGIDAAEVGGGDDQDENCKDYERAHTDHLSKFL